MWQWPVTRDTRIFLLFWPQRVRSCTQNKQLRDSRPEMRSWSQCAKKWQSARYNKQGMGLSDRLVWIQMNCIHSYQLGYYNLCHRLLRELNDQVSVTKTGTISHNSLYTAMYGFFKSEDLRHGSQSNLIPYKLSKSNQVKIRKTTISKW